jgi:hypothetical protein
LPGELSSIAAAWASWMDSSVVCASVISVVSKDVVSAMTKSLFIYVPAAWLPFIHAAGLIKTILCWPYHSRIRQTAHPPYGLCGQIFFMVPKTVESIAF